LWICGSFNYNFICFPKSFSLSITFPLLYCSFQPIVLVRSIF
jgi:hypothetical protein